MKQIASHLIKKEIFQDISKIVEQNHIGVNIVDILNKEKYIKIKINNFCDVDDMFLTVSKTDKKEEDKFLYLDRAFYEALDKLFPSVVKPIEEIHKFNFEDDIK